MSRVIVFIFLLLGLLKKGVAVWGRLTCGNLKLHLVITVNIISANNN